MSQTINAPARTPRRILVRLITTLETILYQNATLIGDELGAFTVVTLATRFRSGPETTYRPNRRPLSSVTLGASCGPVMVIGMTAPAPSLRKSGSTSLRKNPFTPPTARDNEACSLAVPLRFIAPLFSVY